MGNRLANYIRARRKRAGLSERELAQILGYENEGAVSKHELSRSLPPLLIALAYEVIFREPVGELFAGVREAVENTIETRIAKLEDTFDKQFADNSVERSAEFDRTRTWLKGRHTRGR